MTKKAVVTGGCGFIGLNLVRLLLEQADYRIRILDNFSLSNHSLVNSVFEQSHNESVEIMEGDVLNMQDVRRACVGVDVVVHLAGSTSVTYSVSHPQSSFQHNAWGTLNVLEACREMGVPTAIFASSNAALCILNEET